MDDVVRFAVLGPVRAWRAGTAVDLGPPQQRAVVATLLLRRGGRASVDDLIEALWGEHPPRSALGVLRTYVSRLRRVLGPADGQGHGTIETTAGGYTLSVSPENFDLATFRECVSLACGARQEGDELKASSLFRRALALWSDTPLSGIEAPFAPGQRAMLAELRLAALEDCLALDVDSGRHGEAVLELRALVEQYPLRERFRELQMLALYKSGRQAEALEAFHGARRLLGRELGVDPGPGLKSVHQRILQGDPALLGGTGNTAAARDAEPAASGYDGTNGDRSPRADADTAVQDGHGAVPHVTPAQLPPSLPVFAGRQEELERLDALLIDSPHGTPAATIVSIDGMPGIGKTTLAVHWGHRTADRFPDGQLYVDMKGFSSSVAAMRAADALRVLLGALGVPHGRIPKAVDAQSGLYRSLLAGRRVLLVLDNVRDVEQVRPLLPGTVGCSVLITSRNRLTGLVATEGARLLPLGLPGRADAREFLDRRLGVERTGAEPEAVDEIITLCARLPLALALVAAQAAFHHNFPLAAIVTELRAAHGGLDAFSSTNTSDVRTVFSWSYLQLSAPAQRLFRLLALHRAPDICAAAAASLAGSPPKPVRRLLSELSAWRLLSEYQPGRYLLHDLVRAYAAELGSDLDSAAERRAALARYFDHYLYTSQAAGRLLKPNPDSAPPPAVRQGVTAATPANRAEAQAWFTAERFVLAAVVRQAGAAGAGSTAWQLAHCLHQHALQHGGESGVRGTPESAWNVDGLPGQARRHTVAEHPVLRPGEHDRSPAHPEHPGKPSPRRDSVPDQNHLPGDPGLAPGRSEQPAEQLGFEQVLPRQASRHSRGQATALYEMGCYEGRIGNHREAVHLVGKALLLYRRLDEPRGESNCWSVLAGLNHVMGRHAEASSCSERANRLRRGLDEAADEVGGPVLIGGHRYAGGGFRSAYPVGQDLQAILAERHRSPLQAGSRAGRVS